MPIYFNAVRTYFTICALLLSLSSVANAQHGVQPAPQRVDAEHTQEMPASHRPRTPRASRILIESLLGSAGALGGWFISAGLADGSDNLALYFATAPLFAGLGGGGLATLGGSLTGGRGRFGYTFLGSALGSALGVGLGVVLAATAFRNAFSSAGDDGAGELKAALAGQMIAVPLCAMIGAVLAFELDHAHEERALRVLPTATIVGHADGFVLGLAAEF